MRKISEPTAKSLLLTMLWKRPDGAFKKLATGTGFTVLRNGKRFLITNLHNLRGKDVEGNFLGEHAVEPTHISIAAENHLFPNQGRVKTLQPLFSADGKALWLQHRKGTMYDVAALEITAHEGRGRMHSPITQRLERAEHVAAAFRDWQVFDAEIDSAPMPYLRPADTVSIVGFPFGFHSRDDFPIWITGTIASEPDFDYDERPVFLVDARTREGQSGSPVILHITPNTSPLLFTDDTVRSFRKETSFFLGIYSGRLNERSDVGVVWKGIVIKQILDEVEPVLS